MTPEGHGLAGWITFSAPERDRTTVTQAQILMRANGPLSELGPARYLHRWEDVFWQHTLTALATPFGVDGRVDTEVVCVDHKRQWRNAGNIRHNAAIRSELYTMGAPFHRRPDQRKSRKSVDA